MSSGKWIFCVFIVLSENPICKGSEPKILTNQEMICQVLSSIRFQHGHAFVLAETVDWTLSRQTESSLKELKFSFSNCDIEY